MRRFSSSKHIFLASSLHSFCGQQDHSVTVCTLLSWLPSAVNKLSTPGLYPNRDSVLDLAFYEMGHSQKSANWLCLVYIALIQKGNHRKASHVLWTQGSKYRFFSGSAYQDTLQQDSLLNGSLSDIIRTCCRNWSSHAAVTDTHAHLFSSLLSKTFQLCQ